ncbi:hypothetical protein [Dapis sp. BLCC M229]|uniref:hypothetical protein n=1 Tax=Dapis sp. BLCC M229 TaxID=3400188 RepID=UPI003CF0764B
MEEPSSLADSTQDVMKIDDNYIYEELEALGNMKLKYIDKFMNQLWQELESLDL